jgi:hypothetical protein
MGSTTDHHRRNSGLKLRPRHNLSVLSRHPHWHLTCSDERVVFQSLKGRRTPCCLMSLHIPRGLTVRPVIHLRANLVHPGCLDIVAPVSAPILGKQRWNGRMRMFDMLHREALVRSHSHPPATTANPSKKTTTTTTSPCILMVMAPLDLLILIWTCTILRDRGDMPRHRRPMRTWTGTGSHRDTSGPFQADRRCMKYPPNRGLRYPGRRGRAAARKRSMLL